MNRTMNMIKSARSICLHLIGKRSVANKKSSGFPIETDKEDGLQKLRVAREEEYFRRKDREHLDEIKLRQIDEINFHKQQIRKYEDAIKRHTRRLKELGEVVK